MAFISVYPPAPLLQATGFDALPKGVLCEGTLLTEKN